MYKVIEGHPNYVITDSGLVCRSLWGGAAYSPLMPDFSVGNPRVELDGKKEYISRLVLQAFEPTDNPDLLAFHIDGDKANNRLENLVWLTRSEIQRYSTYTVERRKELLGERR